MPAVVRQWLTIGIALVALLGFVYFFGGLVVPVLSGVKPAPLTADQINLAMILSGLVGGIVSAGFGQKIQNSSTPPGNRFSVNVRALGAFVLPDFKFTVQELVGGIYAIVYVVLGVLAIYCAYFQAGLAPDLLKNLANVTLGLFIAILTAFFSPTQ
jgi:hypothetical protein